MTEQLSEDKIFEFKEAFDIFDQDKDGIITINELGEIMKILGQSTSDEELQLMILEVDIEGNGNIDFKDFLTLMAKKKMENDEHDESENNLYQVFHVINQSGTGKINEKELKRVMISLGEVHITDDEIKGMIKEVGDGEFISFVQFCKIINNKKD